MMTINILSVGIIDFYCIKARALPVSVSLSVWPINIVHNSLLKLDGHLTVLKFHFQSFSLWSICSSDGHDDTIVPHTLIYCIYLTSSVLMRLLIGRQQLLPCSHLCLAPVISNEWLWSCFFSQHQMCVKCCSMYGDPLPATRDRVARAGGQT